MTRISVTVPVYNVEKYLPRCLNTIIAQTQKDCEIICVDDGSTDKSGDILDQYAKKFPYIKVIHQENLGLSEARNTAMRYVTGKYTMFVDSDDFLIKGALDTLYDYAENHKADVVIFDFVEGTTDLKNTSRLYYEDVHKKYQDNSFNIDTADPLVYRFIPVATWLKFYLTDLIKDLKFEPGLNNQDVPYWDLVYSKAKRVHYLPTPFYYYTTLREGSITQIKEKKIFDVFKAFSLSEKILREAGYFEKLKSIHYAHFTCNLIERMRRANPELRKELIKSIKSYNIDIDYDKFDRENFFPFEKENMKIIKFIKENNFKKINKIMQKKKIWI